MNSYKKSANAVFFWTPILIYRVLFFLSTQVMIYPDSRGYMNYPFSNFIHGQLSGRTPVYPFVIRVFQKLVGDMYYLEAVTIFQSIISFIAVIYFFRICQLFSINKLFATILVYLYGLNTSIIGWDRLILTESLALSLIVITFFYTFDFIKRCSIKSAIIAQSIVFIMVFERPSSIIYWLMINVFIAIFCLVNKVKNLKFCNIVFATTSIVIIVYMTVFNQQFGTFSLTDAVPRQHLVVVMEKGYYKSSSDSEFVEKVEKSMHDHQDEVWPAMQEILGDYGNKRIIQLTNECYRKNMKEFIFDRIHQIYNDSNHDYISGYLDYKDYENDIMMKAIVYFNSLFRINVKNTLVILGIVVLLLGKDMLNKKIKWINLGLVGSMLGTFFVSYYGTCGEYPRTMVCLVPIAYIAVIYILNQCNCLNGDKDCISLECRKKA